MTGQSYVVAGYLPGYATNKERRYDIANAPGDQLTHLIYCFGGFAWNGAVWEVTTPEPKDETANFPKLAALKQTYPNLHLMISVGGSNNSQQKTGNQTVFSAIAADPRLREAFVKSCLEQFILRDPPLFDGIDVDWEFPGPQDEANVTLLMHDLRTQLNAAGCQQNRQFFSTMAIRATKTAGSVDVSAVQESVDWFNVMAYNFHEPRTNPQGDVTNFNAPLFGSPHAPRPDHNIDQSITGLIGAGVQPRKLVIGIPAYAHSYAGVDATNSGLYQSYSGPGPGTYTPGILTYQDVMDNYVGPPLFDDLSCSSSMYSASERVWISPNMAGDVFAKAAYVTDSVGEIRRGYHLGGLMLWELGADKTDQFRLAEYMSTALHDTLE
ncbi:glycoside hydrolase family 18 protein [Mycobacterium sp. OTB74]|uniref:glycoside hydrolase family 18 protein n=1 Tax=Mycobacterium sp. OTB74 TaxID=1853452 RepID=UPI0024734FDE|nr:glycoside hydrolase family 18 protein [Mycobacterium sp. OTB74]MDH6246265.1 chitinase [Mycobacterium sp. OTB74]